MSDKEFKQAVRNEFRCCKNVAELTKKNYELIKMVNDILWDARASMETEIEARKLGAIK